MQRRKGSEEFELCRAFNSSPTGFMCDDLTHHHELPDRVASLVKIRTPHVATHRALTRPAVPGVHALAKEARLPGMQKPTLPSAETSGGVQHCHRAHGPRLQFPLETVQQLCGQVRTPGCRATEAERQSGAGEASARCVREDQYAQPRCAGPGVQARPRPTKEALQTLACRLSCPRVGR